MSDVLEKQFKCHLCPKIFKKKHGLKAHVRVKHDGETFQCEHCNKHFGYKRSLDRHIQLRCLSIPRDLSPELSAKLSAAKDYAKKQTQEFKLRLMATSKKENGLMNTSILSDPSLIEELGHLKATKPIEIDGKFKILFLDSKHQEINQLTFEIKEVKGKLLGLVETSLKRMQKVMPKFHPLNYHLEYILENEAMSVTNKTIFSDMLYTKNENKMFFLRLTIFIKPLS